MPCTNRQGMPVNVASYVAGLNCVGVAPTRLRITLPKTVASLYPTCPAICPTVIRLVASRIREVTDNSDSLPETSRMHTRHEVINGKVLRSILIKLPPVHAA